MYQKLSERIRIERIRLGFLMKELASKVGMSPAGQSKIEAGTRNPTAAYFVKVSTLGMDVNYIITGKRVLEIENSNRLVTIQDPAIDSQQLFAKRLRHERERLGLSQLAFADLCDMVKKTQALYEQGERAPDTRYLMKVLALGIDVNYLLTGNTPLSHPAVQPLVNAFFDADVARQTTVCNVLGIGQTDNLEDDIDQVGSDVFE